MVASLISLGITTLALIIAISMMLHKIYRSSVRGKIDANIAVIERAKRTMEGLYGPLSPEVRRLGRVLQTLKDSR